MSHVGSVHIPYLSLVFQEGLQVERGCTAVQDEWLPPRLTRDVPRFTMLQPTWLSLRG